MIRYKPNSQLPIQAFVEEISIFMSSSIGLPNFTLVTSLKNGPVYEKY